MKFLNNLVSNEKRASIFMIIGTNVVYAITGAVLYLTLGPIAGIIPVAIGLGFTTMYLVPEFIKLKKEPEEVKQPVEIKEIIFENDNELEKNQKQEKILSQVKKDDTEMFLEKDPMKKENEDAKQNKPPRMLIKKI